MSDTYPFPTSPALLISGCFELIVGPWVRVALSVPGIGKIAAYTEKDLLTPESVNPEGRWTGRARLNFHFRR